MIIDDKLLYYWLTSSEMTIRKQNLLLEEFGDVRKVYEAFLNKEKKLDKFFSKDHHKKILENLLDLKILDEQLEELYQNGINLLIKNDKDYPNSLKIIDNSPNLLYYSGDITLLQKDCVALVGTRHCTRYGMDMTYRIACDLVDCDIVIVSGLATGIDEYAHKAALKKNGKTIAILGSGLYKISPTSNINLAREIVNNGLIMSEFRPNASGTLYSFPMRNRLISGISKGVVVVEAGFKSGALITCDFAAEQGKEVFAVPGNVTSPQSCGTNDLIKNNGVYLITNGFDVSRTLKIAHQKIKKQTDSKQMNIFETSLFNLLKEKGAMNIDEIMNSLDCSLQELQITLLQMNLSGIIEREPNNYYKVGVLS